METSVLPDEELAAPKSEIDFNNHLMPYTAECWSLAVWTARPGGRGCRTAQI